MGHALFFNTRRPGTDTWAAHGYGHVAEGDLALVKMQSGRAALFRISNLSYSPEPNDLFWCDLAFQDYKA